MFGSNIPKVLLRFTFCAVIAFVPVTASGQTEVLLPPPVLEPGARFGASVSLHNPDLANYRLAVGAPHDGNSQQVDLPGRVFHYVAANWNLAYEVPSPIPEGGDLFGYSVSLGNDSVLMIGAPGIDAAFSMSITNGDSLERIVPTSNVDGSAFGYKVAATDASCDYRVPVVSAPDHSSRGAVFTFPNSPQDQSFPRAANQVLEPSVGNSRYGASIAYGNSRGLDNNDECSSLHLVVGAPGDGTNNGAAYIYRWDAEKRFVKELRIDGPPLFGTDVAFARSYVAISVPGKAVYLYAEVAESRYIAADTIMAAVDHARFGGTIELDRFHGGPWMAIVGSPGTDTDSVSAPVVFRRSTTFLAASALPVDTRSASGELGASLSVYYRGWAAGDPSFAGKGAVFVNLDSVLDLEQVSRNPKSHSLLPPAPNPASRSTIVRLDVATASDIGVTIYDLLGRQVTSIHQGLLLVGLHEFAVDTAAFAPGVYSIISTTTSTRSTASLVVAR